MEAPDEYEEESATLSAPWIRGLVSAAIFDRNTCLTLSISVPLFAQHSKHTISPR